MLIRLNNVTIGIVAVVFALAECGPILSGPTATPLATVPAPELLINVQPFPTAWQIDPCPPDRCLRETEANRTFGIVGIAGHVLQHVYRLESVASAKAKYDRYRDVDFRLFLPPSQISYRSPIADDYRLGCGIDRVPACVAIFRYGRYFVDFYFDIDGGRGDGLKLTEVEPTLRAMDARASAVLGIPLPTSTP